MGCCAIVLFHYNRLSCQAVIVEEILVFLLPLLLRLSLIPMYNHSLSHLVHLAWPPIGGAGGTGKEQVALEASTVRWRAGCPFRHASPLFLSYIHDDLQSIE